MVNGKVNVAVVGYGYLGKWHCEKVMICKDQAELIAIVDTSITAKEKAKQKFPEVKLVSDLSRVINNIDAAIVVTPTSYHYQIVEYLLSCNKHVFCEKPLTTTYDEARVICRLAAQKDLIVQVGHSERFHSAWQKKEEWSNFFQGPATIHINRLAPYKGRATDVDVVRDLMIHDLDLLYYLFEEVPIAVKSTGHKITTDKWDYVCSEFSFSTGKRAVVTVGRNHVKEIRNLEITNDHGCLHFDLFKNEILVARNFSKEKSVDKMSYNKKDHLLLQHKHFYKSILNKDKTIISVEDGARACKLVDSVLHSLDCQKTVLIE